MATKSRNLDIEVRAEGVERAALPVTVEATYTRWVEDEREAGIGVQDTRQFGLVLPTQARFTLEDVAIGTIIRVAIFCGDRANGVSRDLKLPEDGAAATLALTHAEVERFRSAPVVPPAQPPPLIRSAQFVSLQATQPDYRRSTLSVAPISLQSGNWSKLGLKDLFLLEKAATTSVEWLGTGWSQFGSIPWAPVHLEVEGHFAPTFPEGAGDAWLWWLNGPQAAVGVVVDDLAKPRPQTISIPLPAFARPAVTPDPGDKCGQSPPSDVTEGELVNNPGIYTEDPGSFCRPFSNPERILSERPFYTLFRVEQPVVSPEPTIRLVDAVHFDFASAEPVAMMAPAPEARVSGLATAFLNPRLQDVVYRAATLPPAYVQGITTLNRGRTELNGTHPVQWEGDATRYQATTVARGHILEYRVRWRSNGYSLGTVSKTLTLAPRQVRRIQKIDWARTERSRRAETTQFSEEASDETTRERQYDDSVQSTLSEWARGESHASQTGVAGGIGFAIGPVIVGGGAVHSSASGSSSQSGGRSVAASEEQNLRDSIRRYGDSLRRFESVVVTEVTQQESVTGTTEIIRNPNYGHSLTVIYYQILRHLRVDTEFAGVRECLFVPFAMKPFTLQRIFRWRETLGRWLLDRQYSFALRYLKDVMDGFVGSTVPPGARCDLPLVDLHGSIYINLGIERPKDVTPDVFDAVAWSVLHPFLGTPAQGIFQRLVALTAQARDAVFQRDHAPTIAAKWADTLELRAGNTPLSADFTLASAYRFNNTVRIDFSVDLSKTPGLTRRMLNNIKVTAREALTPGSVANFARMTYDYQSSHHRRSVSINKGINDLMQASGQPDPSGAQVTEYVDAWEAQDLRSEIIKAVQNLLQHLNEHIEHYHKVIWWYMDRDRLYMLLDGFYVPGTPGISIASVVERDPLAIVGNALVFRVSPGSFLGWGQYDTSEKLYDFYWGHQPKRDPLYVSLPTDGLYAQTIMDECLALEEHRGTVDWVLEDVEPELGDIDPSLLATRRAEPTATTPSQMPSTLINLQNAPAAPDPTGLAGVLSAVTNPNAFRDMAGLAGTQAGAQAAMTAAASLATNFGNQAAALELAKIAKAEQATRTADQKLASIQSAKSKGLTDDAGAAAQARDVLSAMNPDSQAIEAPHQNPAINSAIETAGTIPGSTIEANTGEGAVKVNVGGGPGTVEGFLGGLFDSPTSARKARPDRTADLPDVLKRIAVFKTSTQSNAWNNLPRADLADRLADIVTNPDLLDQGANSLCGPAAFFNTWIWDDPKAFVGFAFQLYNSGAAPIGSLNIRAGGDLRRQNYMNLRKSMGTQIVPSADWMVMSAVRDSENAWFDYEGTPAEEWVGGTSTGEMTSWLEATRLYGTVSVMGTRTIAEAQKLIPTINRRIILMVDSGMVGNPHSGEKDHYVAMRTRITTNPDGKITFRHWTWGRSERATTMTTADFERDFYGAIIAEF